MNIGLFFDGTWNHPEQTNTEGEHTPTNVFRLFQASQVQNGLTNQKLYYDSGVGTDGNWFDKFFGGVFGSGLSKNIAEAYHWLSHNYQPGDQLFVFGFSRGAYTARSLIGMIDKVGLIPNCTKDRVAELFEIYKDKDLSDSSQTIQKLKNEGIETSVALLGCWDTVGSLGIPFDSFNGFNKSFWGFHDTSLSPLIKEAYHAVAIDEHRAHFQHTPMFCAETTKHETMYLHGSHSDVGGGVHVGGIANISLNWMAQKAVGAGLSVAKEQIPSISYDDVMQPITDSYDEFLKGFYSKFEDRNYRKLHVELPGFNVHPLTVSRIEADEDYRPQNLENTIKTIRGLSVINDGPQTLSA